METELPKIERNGDVVVLERVKITSWSGMMMGISCFSTNWTVMPAASIPENPPPGQLNLRCLREKGSSGTSQEQMRYAIQLCKSQGRTALEAASPPARCTSTFSTQTPAGNLVTASTPNYGRRDKFASIKDVKVETFYDLVGQVVKIYPSNGVVELYLTDYTSNNLLFNYEWGRDDPDAEPDDGGSLYNSPSSTSRKWAGPSGKMTLTVSLFSPHSYFAQSQVKENDFVFLRNTRIKWSKDGKVEGSLHTDRLNSDRVDISIIKDHNDERVKEVLRRKLQYSKKFQNESEAFVKLAQGQKRKQQEPPKLSTTQQRKRRKQQRKAEARKKLNALGSSDDEKDKENADPYHIHVTPAAKSQSYNENELTPATSPPPARTPSRPKGLNKNVRTSKPNILPRPLSSIISLSTHVLTTPNGTPYTLPFQNICSRAAVRVVDFFPSDLADFAVGKKKASEFDVLSECSDVSSSDDDKYARLPADTDDDDDGHDIQSQRHDVDNEEKNSKWQWRFALILEDVSSPSTTSSTQQNPRLTAYVTDADAVFLLKLDACNLRRKPQALAALREKLFLLWGDLEERKADESAGREKVVANARSMPFECCIKEYGVRSWKMTQVHEIADEVKSDDEDADHEEVGKDGGEGEDMESWGWERRFAMFGTTIL
ncbi:MAG: hypothetical protein Q9170_006960 [Blastenia crenularia]